MFFLAEREIRLVLYNTRYCTGTGWMHHVPFPFAGSLRDSSARSSAVSGFIASLRPDIVGLVESDSGSYRNNGESHSEALANMLGQRSVFSPKYRNHRIAKNIPLLRHQGNAVVTGLPISGTSVHRFAKGFKNAVIVTDFTDFTFLLVHLSIGPEVRRQQIRELAEISLRISRPMILAGDFNTFNGSAEISPLLNAGLTNADPSRRCTFPSRRPRHAIDMVLHSPEIAIRGFDVPEVRLSDHLPVVCDLALPCEGPAGGGYLP